MAAPVRAFVGLGANLGDAARTIAEALARLAALEGTRLVAVSSLYRSAPVEATGPDFLNAVADLETSLSAEDLLDRLHAIESEHGRLRPFRNAPRLLDLDLLTWDQATLDTARLQLPHPRMHLRAFVLVPLAEIAPGFELPGGRPMAELLRDCADQRIEAVASPDALLAASRRQRPPGTR